MTFERLDKEAAEVGREASDARKLLERCVEYLEERGCEVTRTPDYNTERPYSSTVREGAQI